jgi:hypothetical protein
VLVLVGWTSREQSKPTAWDHKVVTTAFTKGAIQEELNREGVDGWQMVQAEPIEGTGQVLVFFKRSR